MRVKWWLLIIPIIMIKDEDRQELEIEMEIEELHRPR